MIPPTKSLRLWPGVVAALLLLLVWFGLPMALPGAMLYSALGRLLGMASILVWWLPIPPDSPSLQGSG